jgi:hypothetical protein
MPLETKQSVVKRLWNLQRIFRWVDEHRDTTILPTLEMRDLEHSLCAYDKWRRAHEALKAGQRVTLERFRPPRRTLFGDEIRL